MVEKFKINESYKLDEIRSVLGGQLLASFVTRDNELLYVKFKVSKLNPCIPNEIWIKNGSKTFIHLNQWKNSKTGVPFFFMPARSKAGWTYAGLSKCLITHVGDEAVKHTGNSEIGYVIKPSLV